MNILTQRQISLRKYEKKIDYLRSYLHYFKRKIQTIHSMCKRRNSFNGKKTKRKRIFQRFFAITFNKFIPSQALHIQTKRNKWKYKFNFLFSSRAKKSDNKAKEERRKSQGKTEVLVNGV